MKRQQTADLLPQPCEQLPALRGVAGGRPPDGSPPDGGPPPGSRRALAATAKHVWYAAVFPQLWGVDKAPALLERLARVAQTFTSCVSLELPNALLLEIRGSAKLFGSLQRLHDEIDAAWLLEKVSAHSAITPSPMAALWLARAAKRVLLENNATLTGALAALPLACTSWDAARLNTLHAMGVRNVGELLRLPRSGIARRLGPDAIRDLDIALARQAAPRRAFIARERFYERCDFETEIEAVAYLDMAFEPLLERCARFLRRRQAGIQYLDLRLRHRSIPATRLRLGLASITGEYRRLRDVVVEKLTRVALPAPVRGIELRSGALRPLAGSSSDLFAGSAGVGSRDSAPQLVERLRARLGDNAVYGVNTVAEHRPEAAWRRVQELNLQRALTGSTPRLREMRPCPEDMPRPVWLLDEPQLLGRCPSILEQGPERIESGWWDGKGVARDYYIARAQGYRWWVFQERHSKGWYLHGLFA